MSIFKKGAKIAKKVTKPVRKQVSKEARGVARVAREFKPLVKFVGRTNPVTGFVKVTKTLRKQAKRAATLTGPRTRRPPRRRR